MANSWLRLWHDMPNDPKWRTIARVSGQPISAVLAVYIHLLVIASNATERGRTQNVCSEDLASALDLDTEQIDSILSAMQGRVLDGDAVSGWAKRQVEREDGSAERAKRWREAQKEAKQTKPNATERKQTPDTDTDTETEKKRISTPEQVGGALPEPVCTKPVNGSAISLATFLDRCKEHHERPIGDYRPIWEYAEKVGIPEDAVVLAWQEFARKYGPSGGRAAKRYRDWRQAFRNCIEENWLGLWTLDEQGRAVLTSKGRMAEKVVA